ncbi:MAG: hypothetical protein IT475_18065 [Aquimonas sp.]|nr:hypothetical protein [Xanthomonadales bacterium]MCC6507339.1 hypothetical protein [Aquimonas sp.]
MKFSDLLDQPYDKDTGIICLDTLCKLLPETPRDVIEQVYSDHGRSSEFQKQYRDIDLLSVEWVSIHIPANEIINASYYDDFERWYLVVQARLDEFANKGWPCIDNRSEVVANWEEHKTWLRSPVLLDGIHPAVDGRLHLMEGHTRAAILGGLVKNRVISPETKHLVFVGRACTPRE